MNELDRLLLKEELDSSDIAKIKELIRAQIVKLFYVLYVKKSIWQT